MGSDIHIIAEVKSNNSWKLNVESIFPNPHYTLDGKLSWEKHKFSIHPSDDRRYDWFAILANVRNGRGFAGIKTGEGFDVIAEPRGIPEDANEEWKNYAECLHSASWLTIEDFDNFDWNQVTVKKAVISLDQYKKLRGTNDSPDTYAGGVSGPNIITVDEEMADKILDGLTSTTKKVYVNYNWSIIYSKWFDSEITNIIEPLRKLSEKYDDARLCFAFDS